MNTKLFLFLFFLIMQHGASLYDFPFGTEFSYPTEWGSLALEQDCLVLDGIKEEGAFSFADGQMTFKTADVSYTVLHCAFEQCEFVTLVKKRAVDRAYESWEMPYARTDADRFATMPMLKGFHVAGADSFVTEKTRNGDTVRFIPRGDFNVYENPWAVRQDAPSKKIYLNPDRWRNKAFLYAPISAMVVLNGFIEPGKEYLYGQNARAKNIRIRYGDVSFSYTLRDSGNYQVVPLPQSIDPLDDGPIEVEILDSYRGTKYDDIVISGILYLDAQLK